MDKIGSTIFMILVYVCLPIWIAKRSRRNKQRKQAMNPTLQQMRTAAPAVRPAAPAPAAQPLRDVPVTPSVSGEGYSSEGMSFTDEHGCVGGSLSHETASGFSFDDEHGCMGGSLQHHDAEGDFDAMQRLRSAAQESPYARRKAATLDVSAMRNAVIWSEILGKPKSMQ
ncbi:MAG: hypothetical protein MJ099_01395 [Clostridia bacterium]|nr:hypothetical protein [Clostridia bacterium]